jgi:hypothetical protein
MKPFIAVPFLLLLLTSCSSKPTSVPVTPTVTVSPTAELAPPPTAIIAPTIAPDATPTTDTRLLPDQWQQWPVVPSVTGRAVEIYHAGQLMGNNLHAFSKIGDCQNVKAAFMGFFDLPDRYNLGTDYQYLQQTIDNFSGYFNTDGQAVKGGFNAATVLSPMWANPDACLPGESPLECELRITKPSIVFISFEVWWEGRTSETYEKYMRQIIEMVIAHGAVPILATKADNVEGDHDINLTTARLAYEYDLPLWNFWLAVQPLPYHGMDPVRNDGFHISTDGWNTRSFTGLQALDGIWHGVLNTDSTSATIPTATPEPTRSANLIPTPISGPALATSSERIVFSLVSRHEGRYDPQGVYLFDPSKRNIAQLLGPGFTFQSASPDGRFLLVSQANSLYRIDGSTLTLLTNQFVSTNLLNALWLPDGHIALITHNGGNNSLGLIKDDGSGWTEFPVDSNPIEIYPSTDGTHITWADGSCDSSGQCTPGDTWLTDLSSRESKVLSGMGSPIVSPDGQEMAYTFIPAENKSNLAIAYLNENRTREYPLAGDILAEMAWQPNGEWLAVNMDIRSDSSGRVTGSNNYLINPLDFSSKQLPSINFLNPNTVWDPKGDRLAWIGTEWFETSYSIHLWVIDAITGQGADLSDALGLEGSDFLFVNNAAWLVQP